MSIERASTWTCDENDEDVWRMVITPGMISQKANIHRGSLGRPYSQHPDYHGLCYAITPSNIYNMCKARPIDRQGNKCFYGDRCFTIYKWVERLEEATGLSRGKGLYECALDDGQPMMVLVVACSDKPDNVPRPAARIKVFKDFLGTKREPMFKRFVQPRMYNAWTGYVYPSRIWTMDGLDATTLLCFKYPSSSSYLTSTVILPMPSERG